VTKREIVDDSIHLATPWEPRMALCGAWTPLNMDRRDPTKRPDGMSGCWTCLQADDWLRVNSDTLKLADDALGRHSRIEYRMQEARSLIREVLGRAPVRLTSG
jgi:hypothetical protein